MIRLLNMRVAVFLVVLSCTLSSAFYIDGFGNSEGTGGFLSCYCGKPLATYMINRKLTPEMSKMLYSLLGNMEYWLEDDGTLMPFFNDIKYCVKCKISHLCDWSDLSRRDCLHKHIVFDVPETLSELFPFDAPKTVRNDSNRLLDKGELLFDANKTRTEKLHQLERPKRVSVPELGSACEVIPADPPLCRLPNRKYSRCLFQFVSPGEAHCTQIVAPGNPLERLIVCDIRCDRFRTHKAKPFDRYICSVGNKWTYKLPFCTRVTPRRRHYLYDEANVLIEHSTHDDSKSLAEHFPFDETKIFREDGNSIVDRGALLPLGRQKRQSFRQLQSFCMVVPRKPHFCGVPKKYRACEFKIMSHGEVHCTVVKMPGNPVKELLVCDIICGLNRKSTIKFWKRYICTTGGEWSEKLPFCIYKTTRHRSFHVPKEMRENFPFAGLRTSGNDQNTLFNKVELLPVGRRTRQSSQQLLHSYCRALPGTTRFCRVPKRFSKCQFEIVSHGEAHCTEAKVPGNPVHSLLVCDILCHRFGKFTAKHWERYICSGGGVWSDKPPFCIQIVSNNILNIG